MPDREPAFSPRRTLASPAAFRGLALFSGLTTSITIRPRDASAGAGIQFLRTDLPGADPIPVHVSRVAPESRRTVLGANGHAGSVQTVEHLLSALSGLGITDALIEVEGPEIPIGDGSALPFVEVIQRAGTVALTPSRSGPITIAPHHPLILEDGLCRLEAHHHDGRALELEYRLDYSGASGPAFIPPQSASISIPLDHPAPEYASDIAPARTFSLQHEAEAMRRAGLFKNLTPKDMLVIGPAGPIDNAYRFANEPARHKLLDLIGDLALVGRPIQARIVATRTGHAQTHELARRLAAL